MYSIPQHAVTNGYWKIENLRAHPIASSTRLVKNPASADSSLPIERAIVPGIVEPNHEDPEEDHHLRQARDAEPAGDHRPRVQEDELHVEQDEENRRQVELDRQAPDRQRERALSALERFGLHRRRVLRTELRRQ